MKFTIFALVGALASVNARQLRTKARNLDGGGENNGRAALDGNAIIKFAKCVEVKVTPQDEDDDMKSAIQAGFVSSLESYAAFYTTTYATDDEMMMVALGDYVVAKVEAIANVKQTTCETCREFQDTCYADEAEDADAEVSEYFSIHCCSKSISTRLTFGPFVIIYYFVYITHRRKPMRMPRRKPRMVPMRKPRMVPMRKPKVTIASSPLPSTLPIAPCA
jgi:hypothetical protein